MADGTPAGLRGKVALRGRVVSVMGATEHVGDECCWRVTAMCGETSTTHMCADVGVALREAVATLLHVLDGVGT